MKQSKCFLISGNAGQGKTVLASNLALALHSFGFDVLLVDGDMKTPKIGHYIGMPLAPKSMQAVLRGNMSIKDAQYRLPSGVRVLLSNLDEVSCEHPSELISELCSQADVVIIDVPTHDRTWYATGCETILVTEPNFPSALDARKLCRYANVRGIIVNRAHHDGVDLSEGNIQEIVDAAVLGSIPNEDKMREAIRHGHPLLEFNPDSAACACMKQIAAKLMNVQYQCSPRTVPFLARFGLIS